MTNGLRIIFASCNFDPLIAAISGDLYKACNTLGWEFFFIAEGKNVFIDNKAYINLAHFRINPREKKVSDFVKVKKVDFETQSETDKKYLERLHKKPFKKYDIKKQLHAWFAEAINIFEIIQPDITIIWNGLIGRRAVYAKAAESLNIPVYYAEKGLLPGSWYIDSKGVNSLSTIADYKQVASLSYRETSAWRARLDAADARGESAWKQPKRKKLSALKKALGIASQRVIFFPGQVDYDSNILLFSKHFKDSLDALRWLTDSLRKEEFFIIAKPHPKGQLRVRDFSKVLLDKGRARKDINILDAIALADCVVSINSTVLFEAAIRNKPVLQLGEGVLSNKEFVSHYAPGTDSYLQVKDCIEKYDKNKDYLYRQALAWANYLDSAYYSYRGNFSKTLDLLKRLMDNRHCSGE
jgi:capsule polysaccharide export protein KpsC/LpsZ